MSSRPSSKARQASSRIGALLALLLAAWAGAAATSGAALAQAEGDASAGVQPSATRTLALEAAFPGMTKPIRSGIVWRVFREDDGTAAPVLVRKLDAATPTLTLPPGTYLVHASYGFASASKRIGIGSTDATERLTIAAGALKLGAAVGDVALPTSKLTFSVYLPVGSDSEGRLVASNLKAGEIVRLPEGGYHVVSTYGEANAIMRVDLRVESGRLTEATVNHHAAVVTLKLVAAPGGEAFAGTAFSVLTPGGDVIRELIGAFPTLTLAEGEYQVIARHDGAVYLRDFKVESGLDRDIEVLAQKE